MISTKPQSIIEIISNSINFCKKNALLLLPTIITAIFVTITIYNHIMVITHIGYNTAPNTKTILLMLFYDFTTSFLICWTIYLIHKLSLEHKVKYIASLVTTLKRFPRVIILPIISTISILTINLSLFLNMGLITEIIYLTYAICHFFISCFCVIYIIEAIAKDATAISAIKKAISIIFKIKNLTRICYLTIFLLFFISIYLTIFILAMRAILLSDHFYLIGLILYTISIAPFSIFYLVLSVHFSNDLILRTKAALK